MLTQDKLKEFIHYNPETGEFSWIGAHISRRKKNKTGSICVSKSGNQYLKIWIFGKHLAAHRLAFLYMTGTLPKDNVDHINGNGLDNRWCNLRDVSYSDNSRNAKRFITNTSGHTGVYWEISAKKWRARIYLDGKLKDLGCFEHIENAVLARKNANLMYGYHENHGTVREF